MHSCETLPSQPATGTGLLLELGRLVIRARSVSPAKPTATRDRLLHAKLLAAKPSTSQQIQTQPKPDTDEPRPGLEAHLSDHVDALWNEQIPVCIEVLLAPDCSDCHARMVRAEEGGFEKPHHHHKGALLLERWTLRALDSKSAAACGMSPQWLVNAVRSQVHFSQLCAWRATITTTSACGDTAHRRRKLSRETCNYKKLEANCDSDAKEHQARKLNIVYSIKRPGDNSVEFVRPPVDHNFPITDIGNGTNLKVVLQSLPRTDEVPFVPCNCQKRRNSKDVPRSSHEDLVGKFNDLTLGTKINLSPDSKVLDDRLLTPCSENGKHRCSYDDESDCRELLPKKQEDRRAKEIAKYKRRVRKESRYRRICDSTSSEGEKAKEPHTSIAILQASRFDRFRAIGCYRNQTYLTLPASRIETKSPFLDTETVPPAEFKRTNTIGTQTDDVSCECGHKMQYRCTNCARKMVRSEANYNLASIDQEIGARRKCQEEEKAFKKLKCDNYSSSSDVISDLIKRPKLRRFFPVEDRIDRVMSDRRKKDIEELNLDTNDTVFCVPEERKRQKTYSVGEEGCVVYEKCDYGTIDTCEEQFKHVDQNTGFRFPEPESETDAVPSSSEAARFRWRFDCAASMVFHPSTGLPLTSSPAPLRRGSSCFDYDASINGISGIKSALFHPIAPPFPVPTSPASPESPALLQKPTPSHRKEDSPKALTKLRISPGTCLLGSFEESALKGRLEPVATVQGFTCELGASGAFCPPHKRLPVTVFFYAPGGTNAPYMGHIDLGAGGYRVPRSGTVQASLFNPHGTLVKMFVVLYDLSGMPPLAKTFLRQRTLYMPAGVADPPPHNTLHKWLRYLIHLRFMTSKSGKLYLHSDIRIIVSRKADLDTATAHSALFRPITANGKKEDSTRMIKTSNQNGDSNGTANGNGESVPTTNQNGEMSFVEPNLAERVAEMPEEVESKEVRTPNRFFGGCSDFEGDFPKESSYQDQDGVPYELRSFTYAPENPKYSPR